MKTVCECPPDRRGVIEKNRRVAEDHILISIIANETFQSSSPGQFVMISAERSDFPFLGRPISIHGLHRKNGRLAVDFLVRVVGRGTSVLAGLKAGDRVRLLGPLGSGYTIFPEKRNRVLVAGGIGIAPIGFLAGVCSEAGWGEITLYYGARSARLLVGIDRLRKICTRILVSTDDGSRGHHGIITDLFERDLMTFNREETAVYVCGPAPMLMKIQSIMKNNPVRCQVSVEERMACGMGACLGCAVRMRSGEYRRACHEGPVFNIEDIDFDFKG